MSLVYRLHQNPDGRLSPQEVVVRPISIAAWAYMTKDVEVELLYETMSLALISSVEYWRDWLTINNLRDNPVEHVATAFVFRLEHQDREVLAFMADYYRTHMSQVAVLLWKLLAWYRSHTIKTTRLIRVLDMLYEHILFNLSPESPRYRNINAVIVIFTGMNMEQYPVATRADINTVNCMETRVIMNNMLDMKIDEFSRNQFILQTFTI